VSKGSVFESVAAGVFELLVSNAPAEQLSFSWLIPLFVALFVIKHVRSSKRRLETDFGEKPAWKYTDALDTVSVVMWLLVMFSFVMFRFGVFFSGGTAT